MKISIVIPALNEEQAIGETLKGIPKEKLESLGYEVEILVVDGGQRTGLER